MNDSDPADLNWMLPSSIADWQRTLDWLCAVRLSLAGLCLRHVADPDGGQINEGLNADIAALQAQLQEGIDRAAETVKWLREYERAIARKAGAAPVGGPKETVH